MKFRAVVSDDGRSLFERREAPEPLILHRRFPSCTHVFLLFNTEPPNLQGKHARLKPASPVLQTCHCPAEFLPCLERHGKVCRALLSPTELYLVQTTEESDGMLITLRLTMASHSLPHKLQPSFDCISVQGVTLTWTCFENSNCVCAGGTV